MNLAWTNRLTEDEIQGIKSSWQLDKLHELLVEMKTQNERAEVSPDNYYCPGWDYLQADRNGFIRCLNQILKLTDPDQRNK